MPPKRLIRRDPLSKRLREYLDPYDFLLWLSELLNDDTYDEWLNTWAVPIGIALNILFILARGASKRGASGDDDVFGDLEGGGSAFAWLATFFVHALTAGSCLNAVYTFLRKRHYRLFEQPVDEPPATPSARLVRVDSSPVSSSPLRYLQTVISSARASSRAYPDAEREVWELNVWDPKPIHLTLFTLFSPGHLILYYTLLPPAPMEPQPSVVIAKAIFYASLISVQLWFLRSSFSQQSKDASLVHGEVMNEYDTKFVRPSLNRPVRDVGIQTRESAMTPRGTRTREVDVYTPTTIVNRGFRTNPNPNYASQFDPDNLALQPEPTSRRTSTIGVSASTPNLVTPSTNAYSQTNGSIYSRPSTAGGPDYSSPLKPHHEQLRQRVPQKGDGGNMGIYSHAASPLRKAASSSHLTRQQSEAVRGGSPLKRMSTPGGVDRVGDNGPGGRAGARRRETGRF